ncbi:HAD-IIB family hydrolase [Thiohalorhabdus sp.]|uniref:HAD-IIB family hydrolase n=1 Tax=Thiohalorhabdus sp. TaxID=3094134 RepID=UPI002FC2F727
MTTWLLATDMDRTLLPNGLVPPETGALDRFRVWAGQRQATHLAYVTGRHRALAREVMADYALPEPDWLVCNVGTEIYPQGQDQPLAAWHKRLQGGFDAGAVREWARRQLTGARLQAAAKQSPLKVSFYTAGTESPAEDQERLKLALAGAGLDARVVVSFDETEDVGLVDFLAPGSGKARAVAFLRQHLGVSQDDALFAGDSGNDADALISGMGGILVGNATEAVRAQIRAGLEQHTQARVYVAERPYTAGILEGMAHYDWEVP